MNEAASARSKEGLSGMQLLVRAYWDFDRIATEGEGKEHTSTALPPQAAGCDSSRDDEDAVKGLCST